ncbi:flagellar hook protein FlgE [Pseudoprimorskyibacter insulae]|uniref:Flagellar hook protein FlgE n=1 Tax=Pseudoprimorskyibacter insulae TaxID=1695997 RepID=A0A2R8AVQ4_9RHOB|nr:flagellar hook protein FlgE [Pseudoprimorskyibacter insulae]SPF80112.1 Flagellar hook protein FlgE [Pseudoprimorskyibacter insulae]
MSLLTAISGLNAAQADIATTSNNIANVGTVGFQGSRTEFTDVYSSSPYVNPNTKIGAGTMVAKVAKSFAQGVVAPTKNTLDLALLGEGLFMVKDSLQDNKVSYSRNGAFAMDRNGYVANSSNHLLSVFPTSIEGDALSMTQTIPLKVEAEYGTPTKSQNASVSVNFSTREDAIGQQAAIPAAAFDPADPTTFAHSSAINLYDKNGQPREAQVYFVATAQPDATNPDTSFTPYLVLDGLVHAPNDPATAEITFDVEGTQIDGLDGVVFDDNGSDLTIDLSGSTLTDRDFGVLAMEHDGQTKRSLSSLQVDEAGVVWATYGDEEPIALGMVALARFPNMQGLESLGNVEYRETRASGDVTLGVPGRNGFARLRSGALEQANVDLTEELVSLITAQRNYQASAKAFETNSALPQSILNIRG